MKYSKLQNLSELQVGNLRKTLVDLVGFESFRVTEKNRIYYSVVLKTELYTSKFVNPINKDSEA